MNTIKVCLFGLLISTALCAKGVQDITCAQMLEDFKGAYLQYKQNIIAPKLADLNQLPDGANKEYKKAALKGDLFAFLLFPRTIIEKSESYNVQKKEYKDFLKQELEQLINDEIETLLSN